MLQEIAGGQGTGDRGMMGVELRGFVRTMTDAPAICKAGEADGVLQDGTCKLLASLMDLRRKCSGSGLSGTLGMRGILRSIL